MKNYDNHAHCLSELRVSQGNEKDERDKARECTTFVTKKDGQWEDRIWQKWGAAERPRYTNDRTTPILDAMVGELEQNEFAATVTAAGGKATQKKAQRMDGMVRSIQQWSDAAHSYKKVARKLTQAGFDCLRVTHDYRDSDSFEQDLIIKHVPNAIDRVWFDNGSEEQDRSDANHCWVLQALTKDQYDEKWPDGSGQGVGDNREYNTYENKREVISVGEILYKKRDTKTLIQFSNGAIYEEEQAAEVIDDLARAGVQEVGRRERDVVTVYSRFFDGGGWLDEPKETVFSILPVVPFYHCFEIIEDKVTWRRIVEKAMDPQRILNYVTSRQVEEGALAPRRKIMATREQAAGHAADWGKLNTSANPVMFYNHVNGQVAPYETQGAQINPALQATGMDAAASIEAVMGMYAASLAKNPGLQSGRAIELQQNKGDTGNSGFYVDMAKGITYLCKVLIDGAPKIYDTKREVLLFNADGSSEMVTLNDTIQDEQTGAWVDVDDLSGSYDVTCSMGAMFANRQEQANSAMLELGAVNPEVIQRNMDIFASNINAPGMDKVAERERSQLFEAGQIPADQMTDEEKQKAEQAAAQPKEPDAMMVAAQAEMGKAQADLKKAENDTFGLQIEMGKLQLEQQKVKQAGDKNNVAYMEAISDIKNTDASTMKTVADTYNTNADTQLKQAELADKEMDSRIKGMPTDELIGLLNQWG